MRRGKGTWLANRGRCIVIPVPNRMKRYEKQCAAVKRDLYSQRNRRGARFNIREIETSAGGAGSI